MNSKYVEPVGAHLLYAGVVTDTTAKGLIAYPGIETTIGESEITYTDNSKTISSIASDRLSFVVSAATNLFVSQCIKLNDSQVMVILGISGTTITVDRAIDSDIVATDKVTESAYYSVYNKTDDITKEGNLARYTRYFNIEVKGDGTDGRQELIFPNGTSNDTYYADDNISTKPISMLKINASNTVTSIYYFKPF